MQIKAKSELLLFIFVFIIYNHFNYTVARPWLTLFAASSKIFCFAFQMLNSQKRDLNVNCPDFSFQGLHRKNTSLLGEKNSIILSFSRPMASCIPLKDPGASDTGKLENCCTFPSFCLAILSQIRSKVLYMSSITKWDVFGKGKRWMCLRGTSKRFANKAVCLWFSLVIFVKTCWYF